MSLNHFLSLMLGRNCDLLLTKKIWQSWWDVIAIVTLHKIITFILLENSLLIFLFAGFDKVNHHISRPTWQGKKGGLPQIDSKKLRSSVLKTSRKWIQSTTLWTLKYILLHLSFQMTAWPWLTPGLQPCGNPEAEDPSKPHLDSWPTKMK